MCLTWHGRVHGLALGADYIYMCLPWYGRVLSRAHGIYMLSLCKINTVLEKVQKKSRSESGQWLILGIVLQALQALQVLQVFFLFFLFFFQYTYSGKNSKHVKIWKRKNKSQNNCSFPISYGMAGPTWRGGGGVLSDAAPYLTPATGFRFSRLKFRKVGILWFDNSTWFDNRTNAWGHFTLLLCVGCRVSGVRCRVSGVGLVVGKTPFASLTPFRDTLCVLDIP